MSNTQQSPDPIVYVPTPISEPPKVDGWYDLIDPSGIYYAYSAYFLECDWFESEDEARLNEHHDTTDVEDMYWLKPTPLSSLLKDKQKRIEEMEQQMAESLKLYECQNQTIIKRDAEVEYWKAKHDATANMLLKETEALRNKSEN